MFFFNKENVYTGYLIEKLSKVRAVLKREGINIRIRLTTRQHNGWDLVRQEATLEASE